MSWAMKALILIRLDARGGEWVTVDELAKYFDCAPEQVRGACELLRSEGELEARRAAGGAHIEAVRTSAALLHAGDEGVPA